MNSIQIPAEVLDAFECAVCRAVQDRIDNDIDIDDAISGLLPNIFCPN